MTSVSRAIAQAVLFNSLKYALFLPFVVFLYWASPKRFRVPILLVASYVFYMSWRPIFIVLILALTVVNYFLGKAIWRSERRKKLWLVLSVALNLLTLGWFKYAYFLNDMLAQGVKPLGIMVPTLSFDIVLPLGISFFVFEFIHYLTDVYRGSKPIENFTAFALFAAFFPTQIAGPIKRFQDFIPQFLSSPRFSINDLDKGFTLILLGLFKKALIADNLSFFVQGGFSHPELFNGLDLWLFTYAFAFQIYFDFSGYTDIARGSAMLFGFNVPINFNLPYLASNISEFWHRWHISLSTWLRDYLYIPLGGSRCSRWKVNGNLLITMTLGGLWHGAAMHFVIWGAYHGLLLIAHRELKASRESLNHRFTKTATIILQSKAFRIMSSVITFQMVSVGWVLFRADSIGSALAMLSKMFMLNAVKEGSLAFQMALPAINYPLIYPSIYLVLSILAVSHILTGFLDKTKFTVRAPKLLKVGWCAVMMFLIIVFSPDKSPRFIYFQF